MKVLKWLWNTDGIKLIILSNNIFLNYKFLGGHDCLLTEKEKDYKNHISENCEFQLILHVGET